MGDVVLLCEFLARVFAAPPDAAFVRSCRDGVGGALLAMLAEDGAQYPAVRRMTDVLADPHGEDAVAEELARVYTRLFSGVAGPDTVSLYASAHLKGRLFGDATARMDGVLTALGMSVAAENSEPADHLPIQLAVLAEVLRRGDAAFAHRFCEQQLRNWLPTFLDQCRARDPSGFYAGAAKVIDRVTADHVSAPRADAA